MKMDGFGRVFNSWPRVPMRAALLVATLCSCLVARTGATAITNPHDTSKPKFCLNCHTEEIYTKNCNEPEGYCLLAGSVDGLCLTCHIKEECCRPGLTHLPKIHLGARNHPSGLEAGKIPSASSPKTLPLHQGRITCRTCHLHVRERPDGYKLLRLVDIASKGVDWAVLCRDCHKDR